MNTAPPLLAVALLAAIPAAAASPARAELRDPVRSWRPEIRATERYVSSREGDVAFAVATRRHHWGRNDRVTFYSASVLKPMLLLAYLRRSEVRDRALRESERRLLGPMIRWSDNDAAERVLRIVGTDGLRRLAERTGMRHFSPATPIWGHSIITAREQARFFLRIDSFTPRRHRRYVLRLLATIVPWQRWGVGEVEPDGWRLHFKGGWGSARGAVDHQIALLRRHKERVAVAVLTRSSPSHAYGNSTLRGAFKRLLRGLEDAPSGAVR